MYNLYMNDLPLQVSMTEFRDNLAAYLDVVEQGKTVTILRRGKPSAELTSAKHAEAIDLVELEAFRASVGVQVKESVVVKARQDERY